MDFLLGVPTASSIAFGDTATRLRAKAFDAYLNDDWRPLANLTISLGARWEYETPYTELAGHLVNLDVAPGFAAIAQVTPADPTGTLTGASYPASLIRPDKGGLQPRLGVSWRPSLSSSLVVKGGYGIYRNLGVYESIGLLLAHQPPFSTTFSIHNSLETPLTLANPFPSALPGTTNTVAIDPDFRSGYAHSWQVTVQRELPASLTVIAAYLGAKGSHLMQAFLPNTYPAGAENPCPTCPSGFVYITSNGSSLRNAAQFTLRRRLHAGLMAGVQYPSDDVEVQTLTSIDRATVGETRIRRGAKIDSLVQVGHACVVGEDNIVCAQTGLAGSTVLEKNVVLAGQVGSSGHLTVKEGAVVYAQSGIGGDVEPGARISGSPAFSAGEWLRAVTAFQKLPEILKTVRELKKKVDELRQDEPSDATS